MTDEKTSKTRPKIMIYLHRFREGGVERVALNLADAWSNQEVNVTLVVAYADGIDTLKEDRRYGLMLAPKCLWPRWLEGIWMAIWLVRCITLAKPDVIFCPGNSYTISAILAKIRLGQNCPPILCKISNGFSRPDLPRLVLPLYKLWLRTQGQLIDQFVAMADPIAQEVSTYMRVDGARVLIIPDPAIDQPLLTKLDRTVGEMKPVNRRVFLSVGRLVRQKNYPLLLKAFAQYTVQHDDPNCELVIVGDGPCRNQLEDLIDELAIADRVRLPGFSDDITDWLSASDVFCLSSDYEGLPAVIVEALAAGLPVVTTDNSVGLRALIDTGSDGLIVPTGDVDALAHAMWQITSLQADPAAMRTKAKLYSIENSAPLYLTALRNLSPRCV